MKKLVLLLFIAVGLSATSAKAFPTWTVTSVTSTGSNNQDTFSFYVRCDGYLHYSLIDNNGPEGGIDEYESWLDIASYSSSSTGVTVAQPGGGDIVGSIYIGTTNQDISIAQGCGTISGVGRYSVEVYDIHVAFY